MAAIRTLEEITCWKEAPELNMLIQDLIKRKKFGNNFSFTDQIQRSAGSIMDNIAEGFERGGNKEFIQFLHIAKASCGELRSQLYRALDLQYISKEEFETSSELAVKISKRIFKLIDYLKNSDMKGSKYKHL
jgi:four helix bundle protein